MTMSNETNSNSAPNGEEFRAYLIGYLQAVQNKLKLIGDEILRSPSVVSWPDIHVFANAIHHLHGHLDHTLQVWFPAHFVKARLQEIMFGPAQPQTWPHVTFQDLTDQQNNQVVVGQSRQ